MEHFSYFLNKKAEDLNLFGVFWWLFVCCRLFFLSFFFFSGECIAKDQFCTESL